MNREVQHPIALDILKVIAHLIVIAYTYTLQILKQCFCQQPRPSNVFIVTVVTGFTCVQRVHQHTSSIVHSCESQMKGSWMVGEFIQAQPCVGNSHIFLL